MTAFELFHPDRWLVINSSILFEKRASLSSQYQPVPREVATASSQDFALQLHRLVKLKRVCQWHFEHSSPKSEEKKKMNYVRSLWILHCRGERPTCPAFTVLNKAGIGMQLHVTEAVNSPPPSFSFCSALSQKGTAESAPVGFPREKSFGEIRTQETTTRWLNEICIWKVDFDNRASWNMTWILRERRKKKSFWVFTYPIFCTVRCTYI